LSFLRKQESTDDRRIENMVTDRLFVLFLWIPVQNTAGMTGVWQDLYTRSFDSARIPLDYP